MFDHTLFLKGRMMALFLNLLMTFVLFLSAIPVQSQDKKEPRKRADGEEVIRVSSNLVNLDVMVKDKKGKAVTDLKAEDFVLSENGVRQNIEFFNSTLAGASDSGQPATPSVSTDHAYQAAFLETRRLRSLWTTSSQKLSLNPYRILLLLNTLSLPACRRESTPL